MEQVLVAALVVSVAANLLLGERLWRCAEASTELALECYETRKRDYSRMRHILGTMLFAAENGQLDKDSSAAERARAWLREHC